MRKRWLIERGIEIISEASRRLPHELKARHSDIPWRKVAGIGNVLRHAAPVMWALVRDDLPPLEKVCREELAAEQGRGQPRVISSRMPTSRRFRTNGPHRAECPSGV